MTEDDLELEGLDPIERLDVKTTRLTTAIKGEREARRRGNRILIGAGAVVVAAIVVVVVLVGRLHTSTDRLDTTTRRLNDAIAQITAARTDGRIQLCTQINSLIDPLNDIIVKFAAPRPTRTPAEQKTLNAQVRMILLPRRVCTADGVDAYVRHDYPHAFETPPQAKELTP